MRYFVNNVICGWNLFLKLLTNNLSSTCLKLPKEKANISKFITYIKKNKNKGLNNIRKI